MCAAFRRPVKGRDGPGKGGSAWEGEAGWPGEAGPALKDEEKAALEGLKGQRNGTFEFGSWKDLPLADTIAVPKRAPGANVPMIERLIALGGIIVLSPVMLAVAAAIKITSPGGPVVYSQERVGLDRRRNRAPAARLENGADRRRTPGYGRLFKIHKFRTMIPDAEKHSGPVWASEHDPRITPLGRLMRKTRLDELPQLFNILKGEMRLIGPRPERAHFIEKLSGEIPEYTGRLAVHPGVTGLAQIEREYDASFDDVRKKVMYDVFYAQNRSTKLDVKILLRTIDVVIRGKGAH